LILEELHDKMEKMLENQSYIMNRLKEVADEEKN